MEKRYSKRLKNETPEYGIFSKECLICLDNKHNDLFYFNPNCKHNICIICLHKWIKISDKCPACKKSLIKEDLNNNSLQFYLYLPFNSHNHSNNSPSIILFFKLLIRLIYIFFKLFKRIRIFRFADFTNEEDNDIDNDIDNAFIISMEEYTNEIYGQAL